MVVNKFLCDMCNSSFTDKRNLKRHKAYMHNPSGNFLCSTCGKIFVRKDHLTQHQFVHNKLACDICSLQLSSMTALSAHKKTHNQDNMACNLCGTLFSRNSNLIRHQKTACEHPSQGSPNLSAHTKTHSPNNMTCNLCGTLFTSEVKSNSSSKNSLQTSKPGESERPISHTNRLICF